MSSLSQSSVADRLLEECEAVIGYRFAERGLLHRCLTHASSARTRLASNERLEFLGDSVFGTIVCERLYHLFPDSSEGELTRIKSVVVSRSTCARVTRRLGLEQFLLLGKGVVNGDRIPPSITAAAFESIVAGIYLDGGLEEAREFIHRALGDEIERAAASTVGINYKSLLQQFAQKTFSETPAYEVLDEKGPDHSKCFKVAAKIGETLYQPAWGPSKKEAEQRAAHNTLAELEGDDIPHLAE